MNGLNTDFNFPVAKYAMYEVQLTVNGAGVTQINFPVNMYLNGKKIWAMESYNDADITRSPISNGNATWTPAMMQQCTVTLNTYDATQANPTAGGTGDWIKQYPCTNMHRGFNTNSTVAGQSVVGRLLLAGVIVDWTKSYIQFVVPQTLVNNMSALFGVYYT